MMTGIDGGFDAAFSPAIHARAGSAVWKSRSHVHGTRNSCKRFGSTASRWASTFECRARRLFRRAGRFVTGDQTGVRPSKELLGLI